MTNILVTSINISAAKNTIVMGETLQLTATILPANATNKAVTWSTSDPAIATINSSGLLRGVSPGVVVIMATARDASGVSRQASLTVTMN